MIKSLIDEAVANGAQRRRACAQIGVSLRTIERWASAERDRRCDSRSSPGNALSTDEQAKILEVATSVEFRDLSPKQIVPMLADRGQYLASESTFYRVLRQHKLLHRRGRARPPQPRSRQHVATGPWQVASWDITYLQSNTRGRFFYLYLFMDVWSRKIIGWQVHENESAEYAATLVETIRRDAEGSTDLSGWVVHSDNGSPMKGATMLATMQRLGVVPSFSRPQVSNDNPYSEALFRTLKYTPNYPRIFASMKHARAWVAEFVAWYNDRHLHSTIGYVTPSARHSGADACLLQKRRAVYQLARQQRPERWARNVRTWERPLAVYLNPDTQTRREKAA